MEIFRRIFFVAVLCGAVAGLVSSAIQQWRVVPLIVEAEHFETSENHGMEESASEPQDLRRTFLTILATVLTSLGFVLIMGAVSVLAGIEITNANGFIWGLGGFLSFSLMPAIGLPPELPGMIGAEIGLAQIWWWGTALVTIAAILTVAKMRNWWGILIGALLLFIPHIIGAPARPDVSSDVPAYLATTFAANSLFSSLAFWLTAGALYGWLNQRMVKKGQK